MRQMRKGWSTIGLAARLEASITTVDGTEQWAKLSCPLSAEDFCGEYCAWYAEETVGGALGVPAQVVVSCQGRPIGTLVTEAEVVKKTATEERAALLARVDELEAVVARLQEAPTATQERARIGIWLRNQSYETQWAGDLDFKKTAARIEAGEHWPTEGGAP